MIEEYKYEGWKDFQQRYGGTFGWFEKENGEKLLVQVSHCDASTVVFKDASKMDYYAKVDSGNKFHFIPVVKSVYQHGDSVLVVKRIPAKQYKRGICKENTQIYNLTSSSHVNISFENLATIFGPKDDKLLIQWCKERTGNICLDGVFSIVKNIVYIYDTPIGVYKAEERLVKLDVDVFKQELSDVFTKLQVDILVEGV